MTKPSHALVNRNHVRAWFLACALGGLPLAHAGTLSRSTMDGFAVSISGKSATFGWENPDAFSTRLAALPPAGSLPAATVGSTALKAGADGVYAVTTASPTLGGKLVPITGTAKLASLSMGRAIAKALPVIGTVIGIAEVAKELGISVRDTKDGAGYEFIAVTQGEITNLEWSTNAYSSNWFSRPAEACNYFVQRQSVNNIFSGTVKSGDFGSYTCEWKGSLEGQQFSGSERMSSRTTTSPTSQDAVYSEADLANLIAMKSGWPSTSQIGNLAAAAIRQGQSVELEPLKITGPATSSPSTVTTTTKNAQGQTINNTTSTVNNYTYEGNKVTTTTTTTNSSVNTTTGEKKTEEETKEDDRNECEKNPDSLACATTDVPRGDIPKETRTLTYVPQDVGIGGRCPADAYMTITATGQTVKVWDWQKGCNLIETYMRPIVIALCSFGALMMLVPGGNQS